MVLTRKITAGITAFSLLCTGMILTSCSGEVSGTFAESGTTATSVTNESETSGTETSITQITGSVVVSPIKDKDSLFNGYEALSNEQIVQLDQLCDPQIGGDDRIIWSCEKDFYDSLSSKSKDLVGFKDVRFDETSDYSETQIDIIDVKDPDLQMALAPYIENGYTITSVVGENYITYNGERLVGNIFFNNGYHIASFNENLATTGFVVKATDELFQAYVYALSRRTLIESSRQYDFDVTTEGDLCVINITCEDMNDIEIEYDPSTGIMAYIIKIDPSDTVG
ncbi:MAG: hypothetical protein IJL19_01060 [Clostridiales bacterium]|nr:hypothetical protein [Clostridiales bacterium]